MNLKIFSFAVFFVLTSCAPAPTATPVATPVPTEIAVLISTPLPTAAQLSTLTPLPPSTSLRTSTPTRTNTQTAAATQTGTATSTKTPTATATQTKTRAPTSTATREPMITVGEEQIPARLVAAAISPFVNAMKMAGLNLSPDQVKAGLDVRQVNGANGKPELFKVVVTSNTHNQLADGVPLLLAQQKEGIWRWSVSTPKILGDISGVELAVAGQYQELDKMQENFDTYASDWAFNWSVPTPPLRPSDGSFDFRATDYAINLGRKFEFPPQIHHLIWGAYFVLPEWLKNGDYSRDELLRIIQNHVQTVVSRYKGKVKIWSVVNEPLGDPSNPSFWQDKLAGSDWIALAFNTAHDADPNANLILNDYGIEFAGNPKGDAILGLVKDLKGKGVPINGIGFQMHLWAADFATEEKLNSKIDGLVQNIKKFEEIGVEVHITELDVDMQGVEGSEQQRLKLQAEIYNRITRAAIQAGVKHITIFGVRDSQSWLLSFYGHKNAIPLLIDDNGNFKSAYYAFMKALVD